MDEMSGGHVQERWRVTRLMEFWLMARRWSKEVEGLYSVLRVSWRAVEQLQELPLTSAANRLNLLLRGRLRYWTSSSDKREEASSEEREEERLLKVGTEPPIMARQSSAKEGATPSDMLTLLRLRAFWSKQVSSIVGRDGG